MTIRLDKTPQQRRSSRRSQARAQARGLRAALLHLLSATDAAITARLGMPKLAWLRRRLANELSSEYRRGYHNAHDADITDEGDA